MLKKSPKSLEEIGDHGWSETCGLYDDRRWATIDHDDGTVGFYPRFASKSTDP